MSKSFAELKEESNSLFHEMAVSRSSNAEVVERFISERSELIETALPDVIRMCLTRLLPALRQRRLTIVPDDDLFGGPVLKEITVFPSRDDIGRKETQNVTLGDMVFTEAENYVARNRRKARPRPNSQYRAFLEKYKMARPFMKIERKLNVEDALALARAEAERGSRSGS